MSRRKRQSLKFAAGTRQHHRSCIWIVSVRGSDIYIGAQGIMQSVKLSLHKSGSWRLAYTSESGVTSSKTGTRLHDAVQRPAEFQSGWTLALVIWVPNISGSLPAPGIRSPEAPEDVRWFPPAAVRASRIFGLYLTAPSADELRADFEPETVGELKLDSGETLRILTWEQPIVGTGRNYLEQLEREKPTFPPHERGAMHYGRFLHHSAGDGLQITDLDL